MSRLIEEMYEYMSVWHDRGAHKSEKEFLKTITEITAQMEAALDEEEKKLLHKLKRAYEDWANIRDPQIFKEGFQMGKQIAEECVSESEW